jgi:hypothetical protein
MPCCAITTERVAKVFPLIRSWLFATWRNRVKKIKAGKKRLFILQGYFDEAMLRKGTDPE